MKILLLGANGQLGSDFVKASEAFSDIHLQSFTRADIDIGRPDSIQKILSMQDFDILVNCAAYTRVDQAEIEPEPAFAINAYAVGKIAEACRLKQAKLIHISTDYIFGGSEADQPLNEKNPPAPLNIYGQSKLLGEQLALAHCENTLILRSASLYGISQSKAKSNFVETIIRLAKEKGSLRVVQDQIMSPTSSAELADMILQTIKREAPAGIYHAVSSGQTSWYEFARAIIKQAGIECPIQPIPASEYPLPAKRPSYSALNNSKLSKLIGPIPSWQEALKRYFQERLSSQS